MLIQKWTLVFRLSIFILCILILSGCSSKTSMNKNDNNLKEENTITTVSATNPTELIAIPDQVIYYHQGKANVIDKDNIKFQKIVSMAINRTANVKDIAKLGMTKSDIETLKQHDDVLEFSYAKEIEAKWAPYTANDLSSDFQYNFKYNAILFPLTGEWNEFMIYLPLQNGPLTPMEPADDLQKYLNLNS